MHVQLFAYNVRVGTINHIAAMTQQFGKGLKKSPKSEFVMVTKESMFYLGVKDGVTTINGYIGCIAKKA